MTLTEECILALGDDTGIFLDEEKKQIEKNLFQNIRLTSWGEFDWNNIDSRKIIKNTKIIDIKKYVNTIKYYIIWDDPSEPILLAPLDNIIKNIDDVTAVSTNTWLMSEDKKYFVEIYHETRITIAIFQATL